MSTQEYPGTFVTLEGPEGAGKTTQVKLLSKQLTKLGVPHVVTRDPGGTPLGKQVRRILLTPGINVAPMTELLLYQADRAQHVAEVIKPALEEGKLVLCDRFIDSSIAYQGYGRNIDMKLIKDLNELSTGGLRPVLTILFDIQSEDGLSRLHPGGHDRIEREALDFHKRVRKGYLELAQLEPERWRILDAAKPLTTVQGEFTKILADKLGSKHMLNAIE
ncbi:MAG: dTMP kinase [Candidatus Melainabacteria bacterium]|nr:dTMP kinase [Candidatus Melainabacteria bacterium]